MRDRLTANFFWYMVPLGSIVFEEFDFKGRTPRMLILSGCQYSIINSKSVTLIQGLMELSKERRRLLNGKVLLSCWFATLEYGTPQYVRLSAKLLTWTEKI